MLTNILTVSRSNPCEFQVELPGVSPEVLFVLLNYVYFDSLNISFRLSICDYIEALELANR